MSMYEHRNFAPDPNNRTPGSLDAFDQWIGTPLGIAHFECTPSGELLFANQTFLDIERRSGLGENTLAPRLVRSISPGMKSTELCFQLELLDEPRHFQLRFVAVSTQGRNDLKFVGIMRDLATSLDGIEKSGFADWQSDELVRVNTDWYWETNAKGLLTSISRSIEALVGRPAGGLLGEPITAIGTLLQDEDGNIPMLNAAEHNESFRGQLLAVQTATGATKLYRLAGVAVWDRSGGGNGYRGVAAIVPNSARLIERMRGEINRAAKQQFLSAMSHELRTPLNAIIGFAEAMKNQMHGPLKAQYVDYAGDIAGAGQHLLGLIQDLLDISSLDSGEVELESEDFDLAELAGQARAMVSVKAEARKIDLKAFELDFPAQIHADKRRTLQILVNLLNNAVKFTPEGGAVGCVRLDEAEPGEIGITIWDTGPGIAPEDHARVFEKFEQLPQRSPETSSEGTGLGLHISRRLASLMGGTLTLKSAPGEGARFTLTLPRADR